MIWNYGLHWHVDRVWGPRYDSGALYGVLNRSASEDEVVISADKRVFTRSMQTMTWCMSERRVLEAPICSIVSEITESGGSRSVGIDFPGLELYG